MRPRWKILAPVDLTAESDSFVRYAINAANALQAELILVHVIEKLWYRSSRRVGWPASALGGHSPETDIHRLLLSGDISETIAQYADFIEADLLLMNRGRRIPWRSSTDRVIELSQRPVCIAANPSSATTFDLRSSRILSVLRLEGCDAPVTEHAQEIAIRSNSELVLLCTIPTMLQDSLSRAGDRLRNVVAGLPLSTKTIGDGGQAVRLCCLGGARTRCRIGRCRKKDVPELGKRDQRLAITRALSFGNGPATGPWNRRCGRCSTGAFKRFRIPPVAYG